MGPGESQSPQGELEMSFLRVRALVWPGGGRLADHGRGALRPLPGSPGRGGLIALRDTLAMQGLLVPSRRGARFLELHTDRTMPSLFINAGLHGVDWSSPLPPEHAHTLHT